jgi:predicted AlkP superfamily pyrophosphatase or phosphodiesterase
VVISVDALNSLDFPQINGLPAFKKLLNQGSYAKEVISVYPSLTYPAHTSIVTGTYPLEHGIIANTLFQPGVKSPDWFWYHKDIKVPTLYDIARRFGLRTGALLWPVTAGAKINYNLPEIWPNHPGQNQVLLVLTNGSPWYILDLNFRFGKLMNGTHQPELDDFVTESACRTILTKRPNLMMIHLTDVDYHRHYYGFMSEEAKNAIKRQDHRIHKIIKAAQKTGIYNQTTFIILGDHGFLDVKYQVNLNAFFKKAGLLKLTPSGSLGDWRVYANPCDGSAQVYLKDPRDQNLKQMVFNLLESLRKDQGSGIEAIFNRAEASRMGVGEGPEFVVEAKPGYYFNSDWQSPGLCKVGPIDLEKDNYRADHGFSPYKPGYRTFFLASGCGIKKGVVIPSIQIIDEGPTMAELLGLKLPKARGRILREIIR